MANASTSGPRILIVGAGAVGQVFGYHLARAGAAVTYFVRERYVAELGAGLTLYAVGAADERREFSDYQVVSRPAQVAAGGFQQVWVCVNSASLRGPWLSELLAAAPEALLVAPLPSQSDREYLLGHVAEARLVQCVVAFLAYTSPLAGETRAEPGIAFWFPPLVACGFWGGDQVASRGAARLLKAGGCPARYQEHLVRDASLGSALLMSLLGALEGVGFSFSAFRADKVRVSLSKRAADEALRVVAQRLGCAVPLRFRAVNQGLSYRVATSLAPRFTPFDLERYWRYHFTKVSAQTHLVLRGYTRDAAEAGLPHAALDELVGQLPGRG